MELRAWPETGSAVEAVVEGSWMFGSDRDEREALDAEEDGEGSDFSIEVLQ